MVGWISLHRQLMDNDLWDDKPFARGQAWVDILLLANHKDKKTLIGNKFVTVAAGSFITSEKKLMERWGWGNTKVRSFLKLLEDDKMIVKKTKWCQTVITIVNYGTFQQQQDESKVLPKCYQSEAKVLPNTTNKYNKDNNIYTPPINAPAREEVVEFCKEKNLCIDADKFYGHYAVRGWTYPSGQAVVDWKAEAVKWDAKDKGKQTLKQRKNSYEGIFVDPDELGEC